MQLIDALVGEWEGDTRVWFEPGPPADESVTRGRIRRIGDSRFLLHEYDGEMGGDARSGVEIIGLELDLEGGAFLSAWVDSSHMSTDVMVSRGSSATGGYLVLGSYPDQSNGQLWGWRTHVQLDSPDKLIITAYNITPEGEETKAVETVYFRRKPER